MSPGETGHCRHCNYPIEARIIFPSTIPVWMHIPMAPAELYIRECPNSTYADPIPPVVKPPWLHDR